jgi:hypothetical protein
VLAAAQLFVGLLHCGGLPAAAAWEPKGQRCALHQGSWLSLVGTVVSVIVSGQRGPTGLLVQCVLGFGRTCSMPGSARGEPALTGASIWSANADHLAKRGSLGMFGTAVAPGVLSRRSVPGATC